MGRRGPKPTPTQLLRARGSWRGKINKNEPTFEGDGPTCPDWLDDLAKAYWVEVSALLTTANVLKRPDGNALARYCRMFSRWRKAEEFIDKHGDCFPIKDEKGVVIGMKEFPQVKRSLDLSTQCSRFEAEFGLTPASRSRVTAADDGKKKKKDLPKPGGMPALRLAQ